MNVVISGNMKPNHRVDAEFNFTPGGIEVTKSEVLTGFLAARGVGMIDYRGQLDLIVNAGPLERLQSALGAVGDIFGQLTDQLASYQVRGPITKPEVTVALGRGKTPGDDGANANEGGSGDAEEFDDGAPTSDAGQTDDAGGG